MKRFFLPILAVFILFGACNTVIGQNKTAKPFMKIVVEDGKVIRAESLDSTANGFTIQNSGVDQNSRIHTSVYEDKGFNPDLRVPSSLLEEAIPDQKIDKGQVLEARTISTSAVFDPNTAKVRYLQNDSGDLKEDYVSQDIAPEAGWEVIMSDDFEGDFPSAGWNVFAASGATDAYWDDNSYRANSGSWSLFCADQGTAAVTPPATYPVDMLSWAIYGPFDMSDAIDGELAFQLWLDAETDYDYFKFMASVNGTNFYGYQVSGYTDGFVPYSLDLSAVPTLGDLSGQAQVYFALLFESDYSIGYEGAYVDDVVLQKNTGDGGDVDLEWSSLTVSADSWSAGDLISSDLTVINNGADGAGPHYSRLYLSSDDIINTSDTQLGGDLYFGTIAGLGSSITTHSYTVPSLATGTYYLGALVDIYDDVTETDETNNGGHRVGLIDIVPSTSPDLLWTSLSFDSNSWVVGTSMNGSLTVDNIGGVAAGAHHTGVYLSSNDIISTGDTPLSGDLSFASIAPGSFSTQGFSFTVPNLSGTYWVGAVVDLYDVVVESDESNNAGSRSAQVIISASADPDLYPVSMSLSAEQWYVGNTITSDIEESNGGATAAAAHQSMVVLSEDNSASVSDLQLGSLLSFPSIAAGGTQLVSTSWTVPDVSTGTYYLGLLVDVNDDVSESDESNNIGVRNGTVDILSDPEPEIHVSTLSLTINEPATKKAAQVEKIPAISAVPKTGIKTTDGPFVPNQVIVRFKGSGMTSMQKVSAISSSFESFSAKHQAVLVKTLNNPARPVGLQQIKSTVLLQVEHEGSLQEVITELLEMDIVDHAEPNYIMNYDDGTGQEYVPSDPLFTSQWALQNTGNAAAYGGGLVGSPGADLNATNAWDITTGSAGIIVAVIDDGIDLSHPEFIGRLVAGYDFVQNDSDPSSENDDYHGNACAGIIAANDDGQGTVGVAPDVMLMPLRVCDDGCYHSDIIDAIYYATDNGARVISISLGGGSYSALMEDAVNYAVSHNVIVFASAGNDNEDNIATPHYPSGYANAVSVGAMSPCADRKTPSTCDGETWWGSNYGDLDYLTPGTRIYTTDISGAGGYSSDSYISHFNGTSAACPHAAGVAALLLSADPSLTALELRNYMQQGSVDLGTAGYDDQSGFGRLDAHLSLTLISSNGSDQIIIWNQGTADLNLTGITDNAAWMNLVHDAVPAVLPAGGSMIVEVTVDWGQLSSSETGQITISSNDADEATVVVDVTANPLSVNRYTITADASPPSGGFIQGTGEFGEGQTVNLLATPASTYTFVNWTEGASVVSSNPTYSFTATTDRHLVANFELNTYVISAVASPSAGGSITGAGTYAYGVAASLTATAASGYAFINWTEEGEVMSTSEVYSFTVTEARNLVANFGSSYYTVTASVDPVGSGTVSGTGSYSPNQLASMHAEPAAGYEFDEWTVGGVTVSVLPDYSFNVVEDVHLVARFSVKSVEVTTQSNPVEGGTVAGAGVYAYGNPVNLIASPASGFEFVNWVIQDVEVSTNPDYSFIVYENTHLIANFRTATQLTVQTSAIPSEGGVVTGAGQYAYGTLVELTAVPAEGYFFDYWLDQNDDSITADNPYSFTVIEDCHMKAIFTLKNNVNVEALEEDRPFELYPNPVGNYLYVKVHTELSPSASISIYDVNGKVISNYKGLFHQNDVLELKTSHLGPGMYFLRITDLHDTCFTGKLIKK